MSRNLFAGVWSLVSFAAHRTSGEERLPFGERPTGRLIYTATGHMSATLSRTERQSFASSGRRKCTDAELSVAFESFDAYAGTHEVDAVHTKVIHHVTLSNWPNMTGTDQVRYFQFKGDELILTTPLTLARGIEWVLTLQWRRLA